MSSCCWGAPWDGPYLVFMQLGVVRFRCTICAAARDPVLPFPGRARLTASTMGGTRGLEWSISPNLLMNCVTVRLEPPCPHQLCISSL